MIFASIHHADKSFTVMVDGETYGLKPDHPNYDGLVEAINTQDAQGFVELFAERTERLTEWIDPEKQDGDFIFKEGVILYQGSEVNRTITERIFSMIDQGINHKPLLRFLERLYNNPSYRAVQELYTFLEHKNMPITDDGRLVAYKYVSRYSGDPITDRNGNEIKDGDYVDSHTMRTHRNNVGDIVNMPRHEVDDNLNEGCSRGLHIGAWGYVGGSSLILVVAVDPADVVSIPLECECQKMRCCEYEVIKVMESDTPYSSPAINESSFDDEYEDDEWEDEDLDDDFEYEESGYEDDEDDCTSYTDDDDFDDLDDEDDGPEIRSGIGRWWSF